MAGLIVPLRGTGVGFQRYWTPAAPYILGLKLSMFCPCLTGVTAT